jgi:Protein of unknown function (DUF3182)
MPRGVVVVYFSRFGKPLQAHHKVVLDLNAKAIAKIKGYEFGGHYDTAYHYSGPLFFVPDDTLLLDEASSLGIRTSNDLYGGVVPYLFVKTKAITHGLVDRHAERPIGWSTAPLPSGCRKSYCLATPYSAIAMPGWQLDACSRADQSV